MTRWRVKGEEMMPAAISPASFSRMIPCSSDAILMMALLCACILVMVR